MGTNSRRGLGMRGEQHATDHVLRLGWRVVARNHRTRFGELDLIADARDALVFCEVKTCRVGLGRPWDSLHPLKRAQVRRMASAWLADGFGRRCYETIRFDAIGVLVDRHGALIRLDHLEDAF